MHDIGKIDIIQYFSKIWRILRHPLQPPPPPPRSVMSLKYSESVRVDINITCTGNKLESISHFFGFN